MLLLNLIIWHKNTILNSNPKIYYENKCNLKRFLTRWLGKRIFYSFARKYKLGAHKSFTEQQDCFAIEIIGIE